MPAPLIHVALPVHNVDPWLGEALLTLHRQSYPHWKATVVDDGSTDDSLAIAQRWQRRDPRISVVASPHEGLVATLNRAVAFRGDAPLLARLDGDDRCHPERFAVQVAWLQAHPEVDVLDCRPALIDAAGGYTVPRGMRRYGRWHASIRTDGDFEREFLVENPVCHPAVLLRTAVLDALPTEPGGHPYRSLDRPEDYDLWLRLRRNGARFAKLPQALIAWRDRPSRATRTDAMYREAAFFGTKWEHFRLQWLRPGLRTVLWGGKKHGQAWLRALCEAGQPPEAILDIAPKAHGTRRHGVPVVEPQALATLRPDLVILAVGAAGARKAMEQHLRPLKIRSLAVAGLAG